MNTLDWRVEATYISGVTNLLRFASAFQGPVLIRCCSDLYRFTPTLPLGTCPLLVLALGRFRGCRSFGCAGGIACRAGRTPNVEVIASLCASSVLVILRARSTHGQYTIALPSLSWTKLQEELSSGPTKGRQQVCPSLPKFHVTATGFYVSADPSFVGNLNLISHGSCATIPTLFSSALSNAVRALFTPDFRGAARNLRTVPRFSPATGEAARGLWCAFPREHPGQRRGRLRRKPRLRQALRSCKLRAGELQRAEGHPRSNLRPGRRANDTTARSSICSRPSKPTGRPTNLQVHFFRPLQTDLV